MRIGTSLPVARQQRPGEVQGRIAVKVLVAVSAFRGKDAARTPVPAAAVTQQVACCREPLTEQERARPHVADTAGVPVVYEDDRRLRGTPGRVGNPAYVCALAEDERRKEADERVLERVERIGQEACGHAAGHCGAVDAQRLRP